MVAMADNNGKENKTKAGYAAPKSRRPIPRLDSQHRPSKLPTTDSPHLVKLSIEKRIEIAREAILQVRKYKIFFSPRSIPETAYGCVGVLDFVKTGDSDKILAPEIKKAVQKLLKKKCLNSCDSTPLQS